MYFMNSLKNNDVLSLGHMLVASKLIAKQRVIYLPRDVVSPSSGCSSALAWIQYSVMKDKQYKEYGICW